MHCCRRRLRDHARSGPVGPMQDQHSRHRKRQSAEYRQGQNGGRASPDGHDLSASLHSACSFKILLAHAPAEPDSLFQQKWVFLKPHELSVPPRLDREDHASGQIEQRPATEKQPQNDESIPFASSRTANLFGPILRQIDLPESDHPVREFGRRLCCERRSVIKPSLRA